MPPETAIALALLLPALGSSLAYALGRSSRRAAHWVVALSLAASLGLALRVALAAPLAAPGRELAVSLVIARSGPLVVGVSLSADLLAAWALVGASALWLAVALYSTAYVQQSRHAAGYFALLPLAGAALDVVLLAGDLPTLATGLAALGLVLGGLVGLDFAPAGGVAAARLVLGFQGSAGLLFAATWLVAGRGGSTAVTGILARESARLAGELPLLAGALLAAAATLAGLAPLHGWLIAGSRRTLPPVLALLGGAVSPAGLLLALRVLAPAGGEPLASPALTVAGALTALVGAVGALRAREGLPALTYLGLGQTGLAAVAVAEGTSAGRSLALYLVAMLALGLPLAALGAGAVLQAGRAAERADLARFRAARPFAAVAAVVGAAALAGLPPFPGHPARASLLELLLSPERGDPTLPAVVAAASALLALAALRLVALEPPAAVPPAPRQPALAAPLLALTGLVGLGALLPPEMALGALGGIPVAAGLRATLLVLGGVALAGALRLAELRLLPGRLQAVADPGLRLAGALGRLQARALKLLPADVDAWLVAAGLARLASRLAASLLDGLTRRAA